MKKRIAVALSGGVDSSVSALLLKRAGWDVTGLFMRNWEEEDGSCPAAEDQRDVANVCEKIGIPYYTVNFTKEYWEQVFSHFLTELKKGHTPNPDILCNREIKFGSLFAKAMRTGADYLATGHYCQVAEGKLLRGQDANKDQSYFLYTCKEKTLQKTLFPIGHLEKSAVRAIAAEEGLPVAEKRDSTGICFIGKRKFRDFISRYLPATPGPIVTLEGEVVGEHHGLFTYTLGQRKGLGLGGEGEPWFVVRKEVESNKLIVVRGDHPSLYSDSLLAAEMSWVGAPPSYPLRCTAKVRYRQNDIACVLHPRKEGIFVEFDQPVKAVTPGQAVVFYDSEVCLGGGRILHHYRRGSTYGSPSS